MSKPIVNKKMKLYDSFEYYLLKKVGKTIKKYGMIEEGDRILIGVSGGKDSLSLLKILYDRRGFYPNTYEILALHVLSDMPCKGLANPEVLENHFITNGYPFKMVKLHLDPGERGFSTMLPVQNLFDGKITLIRPLYNIPESDTRKLARLYDFPTVHCRCPIEKETKREMFKRMIREIERVNSKSGVNALRAFENIREEYMPSSTIRENIEI
jgi:tRNA 2-thiocytidine biosynthesis protein TtcA